MATLPAESATPPAPGLVRGLSAWDGALITIGSVIGSGIFLTTSDIARAVPHPGLVLLVWVVAGLLTVAGALTYAELGAMFPRAGGMYHFIKEAYGPLWGFLFGWSCFLVIMSGGIAALAVGFGEYLGSFLPFFSTGNVWFALPVGRWSWSVSGGQVAGVLAIVFLTAVNYVGLKEGAWVQNLMTLLKTGAILVFVVLGLLAPARAPSALGGSLPSGSLLVPFGVAMIAALWTYDGWYGLTFSAGEMRDPGRGLPRGLVLGTVGVVALYAAVNFVYTRALSVDAMASTARVGEAAAQALFGPTGARLLSLAVVVSTFGCLSATILYSSRTYHPMAEDGIFFPSLAAIHPRYRTPGRSLWAQSAWAVVLTLSGTYAQLYTYVMFVVVFAHVATGAAVVVLRRTRPDHPRPYRTWGYPWVPAVFILGSLWLVWNTLQASPTQSLIGSGLVALGLPAYAYWRRRPVR
jgi:basic amino acid/polyamine antiporter, APA family